MEEFHRILAGFCHRRIYRIGLLRKALHCGRTHRRPYGFGCRSKRADQARNSPDPRLCAESHRTGPSMDFRASGILHSGRRRRSGDGPDSFFRSRWESDRLRPRSLFSPWQDVAQLNAFHAGLRKATIGTIESIAEQCDGIRCDMAMLLMNVIFENTWGKTAGKRPRQEYWVEIIEAVLRKGLDFAFIAEAYWDLEWELQQQGFDFCYDKRLYDRLASGGAEDVRLHLLADADYQGKLLRFIENHDEPRAAAVFHSTQGACGGPYSGHCARSEAFPRRPDRGPENKGPGFSRAPSTGGAANSTSELLSQVVVCCKLDLL